MDCEQSLIFVCHFKSVESKREGRAVKRQGTRAEAQANQSLLQFTSFFHLPRVALRKERRPLTV